MKINTLKFGRYESILYFCKSKPITNQREMAHFYIYKCKKCGYEVKTEPQGFYGLMSGQYYNFKCMGCKNIVSLSTSDLESMGYLPSCPKCHDSEHLSTWNPVDGKCPRCNREMERSDIRILAD